MILKRTAVAATAAILFGAGGATVADSQINPYQDEGTKLTITAQSSLPEGGEVKNIVSKDEPAVTFSKWDGEVAMKVKYMGLPANTEGARPFLSKNVEWHAANETMEAVPLDAGDGHEDGGVEINIILNAPPASNVFNFSIENAEQLDFFYQAPLWQEAGLKEPTQDCTDTDCDTGDGQSHRPENVVGSYAVYYKDHANHIEGQANYATGKAYHIFRPKVTDAAAHETWATLEYTDGQLSVTVPHAFLDTATYPITVDPTFGYTSLGATNNNLGQGTIRITSTYAAPANGTLTMISACLYTNSATLTSLGRGVVYKNSDDSLVTFSPEVTATLATLGTCTAVKDFDINDTAITSGTNYDLGLWIGAGTGGSSFMMSDTGTHTLRRATQAYSGVSDPPNPFSQVSTITSVDYTVYATYQAGNIPPRMQINSGVIINAQTVVN